MSHTQNTVPFDLSGEFSLANMSVPGTSANSTVLNDSTFWPMNTVIANSELAQRFLDMPTRLDTILSTNELENAPGAMFQNNKILHITISCNPGRLEEVVRNISRNMSEMMIMGGVQRVQYSVE